MKQLVDVSVKCHITNIRMNEKRNWRTENSILKIYRTAKHRPTPTNILHLARFHPIWSGRFLPYAISAIILVLLHHNLAKVILFHCDGLIIFDESAYHAFLIAIDCSRIPIFDEISNSHVLHLCPIHRPQTWAGKILKVSIFNASTIRLFTTRIWHGPSVVVFRSETF